MLARPYRVASSQTLGFRRWVPSNSPSVVATIPKVLVLTIRNEVDEGTTHKYDTLLLRVAGHRAPSTKRLKNQDSIVENMSGERFSVHNKRGILYRKSSFYAQRRHFSANVPSFEAR